MLIRPDRRFPERALNSAEFAYLIEASERDFPARHCVHGVEKSGEPG
jgi:hypothetical protein